MAVGVDQPGQHRSPAAVDRTGKRDRRGWAGQHGLHLAVVGDDQSREMLKLTVGADLDAVDVADQRIGVGSCRKHREEREEWLVHARRHSIVWRGAKG